MDSLEELIDDYQEVVFQEELEFHGFFRKHLICALLFIFLYLISFSIIRFLRLRSDSDELYAGDEDFFVYRVSIWMCSSSLAVSIGAVTLLPFSVLGSEVLHLYPDNYYLKWLNWSLINSMWNYVFLLSNLSLFVLLPFAYFFLESQGFSFLLRQQQQSLLARVYETLVVCFLALAILAGVVDVFYTLVLARQSSLSFISLLNLSSLSTPLLYSFVSLTGVFLLLLSTPIGFAKMFDLFSAPLFEATARDESGSDNGEVPKHNGQPGLPAGLYSHLTTPERLQALTDVRKEALATRLAQEDGAFVKTKRPRGGLYQNGHLASHDVPPMERLHSFDDTDDYEEMGRLRRVWKRVGRCLRRLIPLFNYVKYPILMLLVLVLTTISVAMVLVNTLQLLFGFTSLPNVVQYSVEVLHSRRHTFGIVGALVENTIILYIMLASLVGLYTMPFLRRMRPRRRRTSITGIIANCAAVLLLSSALPVMARTLGVTSFDLLGAYGRLKWISSFPLIWSINVTFAAATIFCLVNKFTARVRREIVKRFSSLLSRRRRTSRLREEEEQEQEQEQEMLRDEADLTAVYAGTGKEKME